MAHERHAQQQRLETEFLEPALVRQPGGCEAKLGEPLRLTIDQRRHTKLLREAAQLAERCRALVQVHKMRLDPAFGEKPQRGPRVGALADTEYLNLPPGV